MSKGCGCSAKAAVSWIVCNLFKKLAYAVAYYLKLFVCICAHIHIYVHTFKQSLNNFVPIILMTECHTAVCHLSVSIWPLTAKSSIKVALMKSIGFGIYV